MSTQETLMKAWKVIAPQIVSQKPCEQKKKEIIGYLANT
jgi:hypothetical protein